MERSRDRSRDRDRSRRDRDYRRERSRDREYDRDRDRDYDYDRDYDRDRDRDRSYDRRDRDRGDRYSDEDRRSRHSRDYYYDSDDSNSRTSDDWGYRRPRSSYGGVGGGGGRGRWNDSIPNNIVLVRGLPDEAVETDVLAELLKTGTVVKDVRLMRNRETGTSLRYCFVEFHAVAEAQYWMEQNQGELMFWGKHPLNMYYSTSRRGSLHSAVVPTSLGSADLAGYENTDNDWTCAKCSFTNFQRRVNCRRCNCSRLETERVAGGDGVDHVGSNPCNTLILRGLDGLTTEENIISAFAKLTAIPLKNVRVIRDRLTGASSGYAFVELNSLKDGQDLLEHLERLTTPLEVDGKALIVAYAKNTFSTAIATLEQASGAGDGHQRAAYADTSYYQQQAAINTAADSSNAAEVAQAAILASQQKKLSKQTTSSAVLSSGPVLNTTATTTTASQQAYPQYPVPDVSTYVYDESSGYYYDSSTGLYYDANSQYFYNPQSQQFLYWDGEKRTYLPAPTAAAADAATKDGADQDKKTGQAPEKKVKVAKKIIKDMEKWAKKMNAQKELQREEIKPPVAQPIIDIGSVSAALTSASADAGFSLLEKTVNSRRLTDIVREKEASLSAAAAAASPLSASMSDSSVGVESVEELIDWDKLMCLLCRRAFPSRDVLVKHQQMSDLHKKNVEELLQKKGGGLSQDGSTLQYRDRARERRQKYGQPTPPLPKRQKPSATEEEPVPFEQPTAQGIRDDNIGNKLLQKMGWKDGHGLGRSQQGIVDPIEARQRQAQAGLGARGSTFNVEPTGTYKERARKTFQQYFQEIN